MRYPAHLHVDRLVPGMRRANRDPLHVLQKVRDDGLAAASGNRHRTSAARSPNSTPTTSAARPISCSPRASRRFAIRPGRRCCWPSCDAAGDAAVAALSAVPGLVCAKPESTFYLFPNVTEAVAQVGLDSVSEFATAALHHTGVSFCTRHHFGSAQPDESQHYIRFAYSGIDVDDISEGIGARRMGGRSMSRIVVLGRIADVGLGAAVRGRRGLGLGSRRADPGRAPRRATGDRGRRGHAAHERVDADVRAGRPAAALGRQRRGRFTTTSTSPRCERGVLSPPRPAY